MYVASHLPSTSRVDGKFYVNAALATCQQISLETNTTSRSISYALIAGAIVSVIVVKNQLILPFGHSRSIPLYTIGVCCSSNSL